MTKATHLRWLLVTALSFVLLTGLALAAPGKLDPSFAAGECDQPSTGRDTCVARYKVGGDD